MLQTYTDGGGYSEMNFVSCEMDGMLCTDRLRTGKGGAGSATEAKRGGRLGEIRGRRFALENLLSEKIDRVLVH